MPFIRNHKIATIILLLLSIYIYYFYTRIVPDNEKIDKTSYHYVNELYMSDGKIYENYLDEKAKIIYDKLYKNTKLRIPQFSLKVSEVGCSDAYDCENALLLANDALMVEHPELMGYGGVRSYLIADDKLTISVRYAVNPLFEAISVPRIKRIIYDIKEATKNMDDLTKIDYVYNWVGKNATYDKVFTYTSKNQSIYNVFIRKEAVCAGFAKASQVIFQNIGIESYCVTGETSGPHMWNIVKYKDKYYYYDSTVAASTKNRKEGLIQEKMNDYILNHKEWYPTVETTRMTP